MRLSKQYKLGTMWQANRPGTMETWCCGEGPHTGPGFLCGFQVTALCSLPTLSHSPTPSFSMPSCFLLSHSTNSAPGARKVWKTKLEYQGVPRCEPLWYWAGLGWARRSHWYNLGRKDESEREKNYKSPAWGRGALQRNSQVFS